MVQYIIAAIAYVVQIHTMNWDDLKIFLAVAEAPSMRLAAKHLGISHSTASRRIDALEDALNVRLFDRLPDGFRLTKAGEELMPTALSTDENLHSFGRAVAGRDDALSGEVRVTLPDAMLAIGCFTDLFIGFMDQYPDIRLKIEDSMQVFDLSKREADVAIRFTAAPPEHLIGRRLGNVHQAIYGAKDYLAEHDPHATGSGARWIAWGDPVDCPDWVAHSPFPDLKIRGHFNNVQIQLSMIRKGAGIGYVPCLLADAYPELVRISDPEATLDVWLLSHRDMRAAARMRAFRQYILDRAPQIELALAGQAHKPFNQVTS